jgi:hypothetical protein
MPLKMMAARGMVPATPPELACVLYQLSLDADATIREAAVKAFVESPDQMVVPAAGAKIDGQVLDFLAHTHKRNEKALEAVLLNRNALDETFEAFASVCSESISEVIAINEVRLLRRPTIIEALYMNGNARMSTIDRLVDLAKRNGVKFELPALRELLHDPQYDTAAAAVDSVGKEMDGGDGEFKSLLETALSDDAEAPPERDRKKKKADEEEDEGRNSNIATKILSMSISEKVRMATLGGRGERDFLIKDNNRLVHMSAVTSPKVQLKDIQGWAANRLMPDGVLCFIAQHRRYRRIYAVVLNLVNNPKMPIKDGVRLMPQLVKKDLKALVKNRNISHALRRQAQELDRQREKKR